MASVAIGTEESCRDRPIFIRVSCYRKNNDKIRWYVIEEKQECQSESSLSSGLSSSSSRTSSSSSMSSPDHEECLFESSGNIDLECESEFDTIRRLYVPHSEECYNSLAVINSHIYLIGGDSETIMENNIDEESIGFRHLQLGKSSQWLLECGNVWGEQYEAAAVSHDGLNIFSVGFNQYRLSLDGSFSLEKLPISPPVSRLTKDPSAMYQSRLLALTKKKLYVYIIAGKLDYPNVMVSYDLERGEWDEDNYGNDFSGVWSAGVVLFNDRYLFSFGSQNPTVVDVTARSKKAQPVVPGIYVFDIKMRQWLPEPVEGLVNDGTILPCVYETIPNTYEIGPFYSSYLLQIGKQNDHRLALVWDSRRRLPTSDLPRCLLIWSKFVLTITTPLDQGDDHPHFYASSLSTASCVLDDGIYGLLNCAAGM